ncbi:hypothetical protein A8V01_23665 [Novosphingobium guangzhouense]|uniref:Uncharacterized protein n=1 Tax=Novosphingobium guangzhouense TaxID=1850347 RepID=A0A2K2FXP6_9SPHN|nr:hypothetical protein A8V01_23665 [Novosphingobium guangzhouense]
MDVLLFENRQTSDFMAAVIFCSIGSPKLGDLDKAKFFQCYHEALIKCCLMQICSYNMFGRSFAPQPILPIAKVMIALDLMNFQRQLLYFGICSR